MARVKKTITIEESVVRGWAERVRVLEPSLDFSSWLERLGAADLASLPVTASIEARVRELEARVHELERAISRSGLPIRLELRRLEQVSQDDSSPTS